MSSPDLPLPVQGKISEIYCAEEGWVLLRSDQLTPGAIQVLKQQFHRWAREEFGGGIFHSIDYGVDETGTYYRLVV
ncbi:MAG: hypothetical protein NUV65_02225 [Candidatus Roizmanbacteria bacterium]|nr:hypothetical protein [Candidatus Roizmanbacteria bacterium]